MIIEALVSALSLAQAGDVEAMTASAQQVEMRLYREDGENRWSAGPWGGTWSGRGTAMNILNIRRRETARMELGVAGPGFDSPLTLLCAGGQSELELFWITWDRDDLAYTCDGDDGARFELALQNSGGLFGRARNERAGELRYGGRTVRFETQRLSGVAFPSGRVPGYVIRDEAGNAIAGMDYRVMRPLLYLPAEDHPDREAALVAAVTLATFFDPANMGN